MAIRLADSCVPMASGYPVAEAQYIDFADGESLQKKLDDGSLGGGGTSSWHGTEAEFEAFDKSKLTDGQTVLIVGKSVNIWDKTEQKLVEIADETDMGVVGDLSELKTTEKGSVVGAINEVNDSLVDLDTKVDELDEKYFGGFKTTQFPTSKIIGIGTVASNEWSYNDYFVKVKFDVICNVPTQASGWVSDLGNVGIPTELKASTDKYLTCMYQKGTHYYPGLFVISSNVDRIALFTSESTSGNVVRVSVNGDYLK